MPSRQRDGIASGRAAARVCDRGGQGQHRHCRSVPGPPGRAGAQLPSLVQLPAESAIFDARTRRHTQTGTPRGAKPRNMTPNDDHRRLDPSTPPQLTGTTLLDAYAMLRRGPRAAAPELASGHLHTCRRVAPNCMVAGGRGAPTTSNLGGPGPPDCGNGRCGRRICAREAPGRPLGAAIVEPGEQRSTLGKENDLARSTVRLMPGPGSSLPPAGQGQLGHYDRAPGR